MQFDKTRRKSERRHPGLNIRREELNLPYAVEENQRYLERESEIVNRRQRDKPALLERTKGRAKVKPKNPFKKIFVFSDFQNQKIPPTETNTETVEVIKYSFEAKQKKTIREERTEESKSRNDETKKKSAPHRNRTNTNRHIWPGRYFARME